MSAPTETAATVSLDETPVLGNFVSGVVLTFGTRLLMLAGVFGSGVSVARWLSADGFGTYAVLNVMVALAVQIGSAGLPSANTFFLARGTAREPRFEEYNATDDPRSPSQKIRFFAGTTVGMRS